VGTYEANDFFVHSFYRLADGTIFDYDEPEAECRPSTYNCTVVTGINAGGTEVGYFYDGTTTLGFLRDPLGNFTEVNFPESLSTSVAGINSAGAVAGYYTDSGNAVHGFVRDAEGNFTEFNAPDGANGTYPSAINSQGEIIGDCLDGNFGAHAFLRASDGKYLSLEQKPRDGTKALAIDDAGRVMGYFSPIEGEAPVVFLRDTLGGYTNFSVPGAYFTFPSGIDRNGTITGQFTDYPQPYVWHGFYRLLDGTIGIFDPPNSVDTQPSAISPQGEIAGIFTDANNQVHGFVRVN
jgi:hypothetical protein